MKYRSLDGLICSLIVVLVACVMVTAFVGIKEYREEEFENVKGRLDGLASTASANTADTLHQIDNRLTIIAGSVSRSIDAPSGAADRMDELRRVIVQARANGSSLYDLWILDAAGREFFHLNSFSPSRFDVDLQSHAVRQRMDPGLGLAIGPSVRDRESGDWLISLSRSFTHGDIEQMTVVAVVQASVIAERFHRTRPDLQGRVAWYSRDGQLLASVPSREDDIGRSDANQLIFHDNPSNAEPIPRLVEISENGNRVLRSYQAVNGFPLIVSADFDERAILKNFHRQNYFFGALLLLLGVLCGWAMLMFLRRSSERIRLFDEITAANRALEQSERKFRNLVEGSPQGVVITTLGGECLYVNEEARKQLRYESREELLSVKCVLDLIEPEKRDRALRFWRLYIKNGRNLGPHEIEILRPTGRVGLLQYTLRKFSWDGQPAIQIMFADITLQRQLQERHTQTSKMEALGQIAAGVGHEFNNILQIVSGHVEILADDMAEDSSYRRSMDAISAAVTHAADITHNLMAYCEEQTFIPELVDLVRIVRENASTLRETIGEDVELRVEENPGLSFVVDMDQDLFQEAISNLATNARDAMPDGGVLTIRFDRTRLDGGHIEEFGAVAAGDYVCMAVSDTGCGMPLDVARRVFAPFFTTKEVGKGTGLGLSMVRGLVKRFGGFASLDTHPGNGSTFSLYLPCPKSDAARPTGEPRITDALAKAG